MKGAQWWLFAPLAGTAALLGWLAAGWLAAIYAALACLGLLAFVRLMWLMFQRPRDHPLDEEDFRLWRGWAQVSSMLLMLGSWGVLTAAWFYGMAANDASSLNEASELMFQGFLVQGGLLLGSLLVSAFFGHLASKMYSINRNDVPRPSRGGREAKPAGRGVSSASGGAG
ncbi:MAG: hypothetical protein ACIAS6_14465 [Phycisphaerales bacterium JB060]